MSDVATNYNQVGGTQFSSTKNNNFNTDVKAMYDSQIERVAARVSLSGNQSIPNATDTPVTAYNMASPTFNEGSLCTLTDSRVFNPGGAGSITADTIQVPDEGLYLVTVQGRWASNSAGFRRIDVKVCSSGFGAASSVLVDDRSNNASTLFTRASGLAKLNAGDILWVVVRQTSGGALNFEGAGPNFFEIIKLTK